MPVSICRHIHVLGRRCESPALRGMSYCYFHARGRLRHQPVPAEPAIIHPMRADNLGQAAPIPASSAFVLDFPPIEDHESIQVAASMILSALGRNAIDPRRAATLLYALQVATTVSVKDYQRRKVFNPESQIITAEDGTDIALLAAAA